jgi:plastocyanin
MALFAAGACNSSSGVTSSNNSSLPGPNQVIANTSNAFDPSTLTVAKGTSVTFTFQSVGHNVFFDAATGAPADISAITSNASVTRQFSTSGTFRYNCHVHPGMSGTVVVN